MRSHCETIVDEEKDFQTASLTYYLSSIDAMSETFEKVLMKDHRPGCIAPTVKYQVFKGGQNITCSTFKADAIGRYRDH